MNRLLRRTLAGLWLALLSTPFALSTASAAAQPAPSDRELPPGLQVPAAAQPVPGFDADAATAAYLDLLTPEQREKSDRYFEGGYWIELWGLFLTLAVSYFLLRSGWSRRLADWAGRRSRFTFVRALLCGALYLVISSVLTLPWALYSDFWREHQYGLATLGLGQWLGEGAIGLAIGAVFGGLVIGLVYWVAHRSPRQWWIWAGGIVLAVMFFAMAVQPVLVAPLFNDYEPLAAGPLKDDLLSLARAHGIPADDIFTVNASKQTTRISANVSGFGGTTRISLNDNLLNRTSPQEIRAVMGHEMGHYVLNHTIRLPIYFSLLVAGGFFILHLSFEPLLKRWGSEFKITGRNDLAGLPLAAAVLAVYFALTTPLANSIIRQAEAEADAYGIAVANEPHGFAMAAMRLSTYRKIHPGNMEEIFFFDHPSGYARVHRSMTWAAENLEAARQRLNP